MKNIFSNREKGFTLIEILIALALLAIISAVVIPNVVGYLGKGEKQAYNTDKGLIQSAVDAYYADPGNRLGGKKTYPLFGDNTEKQNGGTPTGDGAAWTAGTGYFIKFDTLVDKKYLTDVPASASGDNKTGAQGSYSWYVKTNGKVESALASSFSTSTANTGFVDGVYP